MRTRISAFMLSIFMYFVTGAASAADAPASAGLVDTWRLVSFEDVENGQTIQIANPVNPSCSPEQIRALLDGYVAYWGTYIVDAAAGIVFHHVQSDLWTRVLERVH